MSYIKLKKLISVMRREREAVTRNNNNEVLYLSCFVSLNVMEIIWKFLRDASVLFLGYRKLDFCYLHLRCFKGIGENKKRGFKAIVSIVVGSNCKEGRRRFAFIRTGNGKAVKRKYLHKINSDAELFFLLISLVWVQQWRLNY